MTAKHSGRAQFALQCAPLRLACVAIALLIGSSGCGSERTTPVAPEAAFRSFRAALRGVARGSGGEAAWAMLGPETRARLTSRATEAQAAGEADATPAGMLEVAWAAHSTDIVSVETVTSDDSGATLRVVTHNGQSWLVDAERGETGWVFELPEPGQAPTPEPNTGTSDE